MKTVREIDGVLLGNHPLAGDGLEAILAGRDLDDCPVWGHLSIEVGAHEHFGRHFPEQPTHAVDRPVALERTDGDA